MGYFCLIPVPPGTQIMQKPTKMFNRGPENPVRGVDSPMKIGFSEQLHRKIIFSGGRGRIRRPQVLVVSAAGAQ